MHKSDITTYPKFVLLNDYRCDLGESPVWDEKKKTFIAIDVLEGEIISYDMQRDKTSVYKLDALVGAIALCENHDLIVATSKGFALLDRKLNNVIFFADPEKHLPNNRFNDGKCDPSGRFLAGTMAIDQKSYTGHLYSVGTQKIIVEKLKDIGCSNGMAWNEKGNVFYYIDTLAREVWEFDYNLIDGSLKNKKVIIKISAQDGYPDGMTIDTEGNLWIAIWDGAQIQKWDPKSKTLLNRFMLPVSRPTSCTFGGKNLTDLIITTAKFGLTEQQLADQKFAGHTLVIKNAGQGWPVHRYSNRS